MKRKRSHSPDEEEEKEPKKVKNVGNSVRILICGSVNGHLDYFYELLSSINNTTKGPFLAVFCVGTFIVEENMSEEDKKYISGNKQAPIRTYVVDSGRSSEFFKDFPHGGEVKNNVSSLCGVFDPELEEDSKDVGKFGPSDIKRVISSPNLTEKKIDLFLTTKNPSQILNRLLRADHPRLRFSEGKGKGEENHFCNHVRELAIKIRPRYHFCSCHPSQYFERVPYEHNGIITRFIHLQEIPIDSKTEENSDDSDEEEEEEEKEKDIIPPKFKYFCYGLNIIPFELSSFSHLASVTPKYFTPSPYLQPQQLQQQQQQQFQNNRSMMKPLENQQEISNFNPQQQCWFCLSNPNLEKSFILDIGKTCYLAFSKFSIIGFDDPSKEEYHILIIPIRHVDHYHSLFENEKLEIQNYLSRLQSCFGGDDFECISYERTIRTKRGNHMFVNFLSISSKTPIMKSIQQEIEKEAKKNFLLEENLQRFDGGEDTLNKEMVMSTIRKNSNYLYFEFKDHSKMLYLVEKRIDLNFIKKAMLTSLEKKEIKGSEEIVELKVKKFKEKFV